MLHTNRKNNLTINKSMAGFTLIEILVTIAILAIALTAIIKTTSQAMQQMLYLQNKSIATWVGLNVISELRLNLLSVPAGSSREKEENMLNQQWAWKASLQSTPNPHIQEINVTVSLKNNPAVLAQLKSYLYVKNV